MPIDASIALQGRSPVYEPLEVAQERQLTLRNLMQRQQLGNQAVQEGQLGLEQKRRDVADELATRQIVMNVAGGGTTAAAPGGQQIGAPPIAGVPMGAPAAGPGLTMNDQSVGQLVQQLRAKGLHTQADAVIDHYTKMGQARAIAHKDDSEALKFDAETSQKQLDQAASLSGALLNLPPEQRAAAYPAFVADLTSKKLVKPGEMPAEYPGDAALHQLHDSGLSAQAQLKQHIDDAEEARNAALAPSVLAGSKAEAVTKGVTAQQMTDLGMTAEQKATLERQTAANAETSRHNKKDEGIAGGRLAVEGGRLAVEKARYGFESSGGVSPAAQMAADGRMDPATLRAIVRTNPGLIAQIKTVDPNFDMADNERRYGTLKEFNSTSIGKAGGQALALNTLIHHADLYMQAGEALKNGNFKPGNAVYNAVATAFGSAPPQNAGLLAQFFAGETGKVATGGVPAEGEIKAMLSKMGTDSGPDQIKGAGQTLLQIAGGRATPLMERVKEAKLENVVHVLGPDAKEILNRRGFDPETMKLRSAGGGAGNTGTTYSKTATGPGGHKIGSNDGQTWFDVQTGKKVQ